MRHRIALLSRSLLRDERGHTLVELMIAGALSVVVLGAVLGLLDRSARYVSAGTERGHLVREGSIVVDQMIRDVRQASQITVNSPSSVTLRTYVREGDASSYEWYVDYNCYVETGCSRLEFYGGRTRMATGLQNTDVFAVSGRYVSINLVLRDAATKTTVRFEDGAEARNGA